MTALDWILGAVVLVLLVLLVLSMDWIYRLYRETKDLRRRLVSWEEYFDELRSHPDADPPKFSNTAIRRSAIRTAISTIKQLEAILEGIPH